MATKIFINLPVKDLPRSIAFFTALGYTFNPQFTDETATCMIISEDIFAMLVTEPKFLTFTKKGIADTAKTTEVLLAVSVETREAVDDMIAKALAAGGTSAAEKQDHGFMYYGAFCDLDGHHWEIMWMNPDAPMPENNTANA
jgi:hypothetical protein